MHPQTIFIDKRRKIKEKEKKNVKSFSINFQTRYK